MSAIGAMISGCQFKHLLLAWFKEKTSRKEQKMVGGWVVGGADKNQYVSLRTVTDSHPLLPYRPHKSTTISSLFAPSCTCILHLPSSSKANTIITDTNYHSPQSVHFLLILILLAA